MSSLEKHIDVISKRIGIKLEKTTETTPGKGNCWYEATALLSRTYNVKNISAKQLRALVVNNLEKCPNFDYFFEISCNSDHEKLRQFKATHSREGEYTDMDGEMVIATAHTLGVSIRIYSKDNSQKCQYLEHNPGKSTVFHIFLDKRFEGSEHYQSLNRPKKPNGKKEDRKKSNIFEYLDDEGSNSDTSDIHTPTEISNFKGPKETNKSTKPIITNYCAWCDRILVMNQECKGCEDDENNQGRGNIQSNLPTVTHVDKQNKGSSEVIQPKPPTVKHVNKQTKEASKEFQSDDPATAHVDKQNKGSSEAIQSKPPTVKRVDEQTNESNENTQSKVPAIAQVDNQAKESQEIIKFEPNTCL